MRCRQPDGTAHHEGAAGDVRCAHLPDLVRSGGLAFRCWLVTALYLCATQRLWVCALPLKIALLAAFQPAPFANELTICPMHHVVGVMSCVDAAGMGEVWLSHGGMLLMAHSAFGLHSHTCTRIQIYTHMHSKQRVHSCNEWYSNAQNKLFPCRHFTVTVKSNKYIQEMTTDTAKTITCNTLWLGMLCDMMQGSRLRDKLKDKHSVWWM